jgi:hypothetical protein
VLEPVVEPRHHLLVVRDGLDRGYERFVGGGGRRAMAVFMTVFGVRFGVLVGSI